MSRESQIIEFAARGCTDKEISQKLGVATSTIATYWRRIRKKTHAQSRAEIVARSLIDAKKEFESVLSVFPDLVYRLRQDRKIAAVLPTQGNKTNDDFSEIIDKRIESVFDKSIALEIVSKVQQAQLTARPQEIHFSVFESGEIHNKEVRFIPMNDGDLLAIVRDMPHELSEQDVNQEFEFQKEAIAKKLPDPMGRISKNGYILGAFCPSDFSINCPPKEQLGKHISQMVAPEVADKYLHAISRALKTAEVQEFYLESKIEGIDRIFEVRVIRANDYSAFTVMRDLTEFYRKHSQPRAVIE